MVHKKNPGRIFLRTLKPLPSLTSRVVAPRSACAGRFFYRFGFGLDFFLPFFRAAAAAFLPAAVYG